MNGFRPSSIRRAVSELETEAAIKAWVEAWIDRTLDGDAKLGRSGSCFTVDPMIAVGQKDRAALKSRGIICYAGRGNYFQVDYSKPIPRIIHRRPLAQRYVQLIPGGTA